MTKDFSESFAKFKSQLVKDSGIIIEQDSFSRDNLSEEQLAAVTSNSKNSLVIAGSGSGKTRVISERVKYLVEDCQVSPKNIVVITYTNLAAEEMNRRIKGSLSIDISEMFIGTIHSFANRVYKGSDIDYRLWTEDSIYYQSKLILESIGMDVNYLDSYLDLKDSVRLGKITPEEFSINMRRDSKKYSIISDILNMDNKPDPFSEVDNNLFLVGQKYNYISFDQLISDTTKYCNDNNLIIDHLLIDEFQDISNLEYEFFISLNSNNNFYVGDDWQSIYGFKGSNSDIFKSIYLDSKYEKYMLTNNYRSSKSVLDTADLIISQVDDRIDKKVNIKNESKGISEVYSSYDLHRILAKIVMGKDFRNYAILTRSNKDVVKIISELKRNKIPNVSLQSKSRYNESELRNILNSDRVKVMTVHSAKGLEFPKVVLYGKSFDILVPDWKIKNMYHSFYNKKDLDRYNEERRIMYVGCTRAIDELYILN